MDNSGNKMKTSTVVTVVIVLLLMGVVTEYMSSPNTNFIQDVLLWIGGSVVILALGFYIVHLFEKNSE
jgi:hypothetical protein